MFGLLRRARRPRPAARPNTRTVLRVDGLEVRVTPSDFYGNDGRVGDINPVNQPPVVSGLTYEEIGNGVLIIRGRVTDENPGGLTVTIGGMVNASGTTLSDGTFAILINVQFSGTVTASTVDDRGQASNVAEMVVGP